MTQVAPRQTKDIDKSFEEEEEYYIDIIEGQNDADNILDDMNHEDCD